MSGSRLLLLLAVPALVAVVGCQTASPAAAPQTTPVETVGVDATVSAAATTTADAATSSDATTTADTTVMATTPEASPTAVPTPAPRPTPRPLPTPIPASKELEPAATALETKLSAFRSALRSQDVNGALRLQRELVVAANDADAALKADKSPGANSVRGAIANIRTGIGGDNNALDHAESALRQVLGGSNGTLGITTDSSQDSVGDLHTLNVDLHDFLQAVQGKNSGDALRLQGKLLQEVAIVQKTSGSNNSALSDALAALQKGLNGDSTSLAVAGAMLDKLDTGPGQGPATPDYAGLAASLAAKMDAFETATSTASQSDLLRLQQEILAEATQDETALGADQSAQAAALRDAIKGARASVSGDLTKLDSARAKLGSVSDPAAASGATTAKAITDLKGFARDLDSTVGSFQDALQRNDTSSMLRLQKALADQADQADASLKGVQSKPAQDVLAAVGAIRSAFAGDMSKLTDARVQLRAISGAAAAPTVSASKPTPSSTAKFDPQLIMGGVRDKLSSLDTAIHDPHQSPDEIAKRRDAVNNEAIIAAAALQGVTDPRADQLRTALTVAREAAAGDDAKIQSALSALKGQ